MDRGAGGRDRLRDEPRRLVVAKRGEQVEIRRAARELEERDSAAAPARMRG
jgi:hypothetical protein